jgi:hypothetical protein
VIREGVPLPIYFKILRNGDDFSCSADKGPAFFVGRRVPYEGHIGLYNIFRNSKVEKLNYSAADFEIPHGFWATLIEPTAICEGLNFLTLNTYDDAAFTFGFGQFAAHVPNGDFVKYFRALLALPNAADYFPHLGIMGGRICQTDGTQPAPLETDETTRPLMDYLNPDSSEVQDSEVIAAAKLIHWTHSSVDARVAQVNEMVNVFRSYMASADRRVGIDGLAGSLCSVIADILHQGRGGKNTTWPQIHQALNSAKPYEMLLAIGPPKFDSRKVTLKKAIDARPVIAAKRWSRAQNDFV